MTPAEAKLFADAVAMLGYSACPACGTRGNPKSYVHPYAPEPDCRWCRERLRVVETYKRLMLRKVIAANEPRPPARA